MRQKNDVTFPQSFHFPKLLSLSQKEKKKVFSSHKYCLTFIKTTNTENLQLEIKFYHCKYGVFHLKLLLFAILELLTSE